MNFPSFNPNSKNAPAEKLTRAEAPYVQKYVDVIAEGTSNMHNSLLAAGEHELSMREGLGKVANAAEFTTGLNNKIANMAGPAKYGETEAPQSAPNSIQSVNQNV